MCAPASASSDIIGMTKTMAAVPSVVKVTGVVAKTGMHGKYHGRDGRRDGARWWGCYRLSTEAGVATCRVYIYKHRDLHDVMQHKSRFIIIATIGSISATSTIRVKSISCAE